MSQNNITLAPLQPDDREQFILDNQWAFKYGAQQEFGLRDTRTEEGEEVISRTTIENSIDGENDKNHFGAGLLPGGDDAVNVDGIAVAGF